MHFFLKDFLIFWKLLENKKIYVFKNFHFYFQVLNIQNKIKEEQEESTLTLQ